MKRNLGIFATVLLGGALTAQAQSGVNIGGYVDTQYNWSNITNTGGVSNADNNVNTFRFSEAALYLSKKVGGAEVYVDIDVMGAAKASTSGFNAQVVDSSWTVGQTQSQAYVAMNYDDGISWRMGQFDSLFGYEANDSHARRYAEAGHLYNAMPTTHVGLHGTYEFSDMLTLHGLVSNPYDQGHMKNGNLDFGIKANTKFDTFAFNLGTLINTGDHSASGSDKQMGYIVDMDLSADWGTWDAALYGYAKKEDVKGTKSDFGVGIDVGMEWSESTNVGLRFEWEKDGTEDSSNTAVADDTTMAVTVGPQFHLAEGFVTKLDYTWATVSYDAGGDSQTSHAVNLAGVFKF